MKEIYINADDYNSDSIRTIQGNNNAEEYKIYLQYDNEKIDLTNKTVNLGFLKIGSTEGDIIENLNVTDPKNGEITLKITNKLSKKNGTYSCQLAILGEGDFLEHTATFTLTVENNIFSDITKVIADSKDFTYLENILDKASKLSEKLKENTSSATNANSNLESNITEANNINSKLLENTSTATSLNKNLESNIDLAKEVKETIKDLDTKNIEATEKIETLTGLNAKATELSNNIQQGLPLNSELVKNVESAKTANNELIATNNDAKAKKTDLDNSLEEAKKYISGLDGSQNIPQIRLDVDALQNGLKSNQALEYQGSSINAENTLEGRTEGMKIGGRTLQNLIKDGKGTFVIDKSKSAKRIYEFTPVYNLEKGKKYKGYIFVNNVENTAYGISIYGLGIGNAGAYGKIGKNTGIVKFTWNTSQSDVDSFNKVGIYIENTDFENGGKATFSNFMLFEEGTDLTYIDEYFEGLKSFGEAEKEGDKYKISILSHGKNLFDINKVKLVLFNSNGYIATENYNNTPSINLEPNTNYSIKFPEDAPDNKGFLFDRNGFKTREISQNTSQGYIFTTTNDEVGFSFYRGGGQITFKPSDINNYKIMLIEGTKTIDYEPYQFDKKDILIKEPLREGDIMYEDNGQVKVNRYTRQYNFTGDESWNLRQDASDEKYLYFQYDSDLKGKTGYCLCNNFMYNTEALDKKEFIRANVFNTKFLIGIKILKTKLSTPNVDGFKEWLKANPTTIVYQLAEPTTEIVENCVDIDLDTFGEKTYFNILNSLPGSLDFKVPSNIASIVQNTAREVNNIWDVINNLLVPSLIDINKNVAMSTIKNNLK